MLSQLNQVVDDFFVGRFAPSREKTNPLLNDSGSNIFCNGNGNGNGNHNDDQNTCGKGGPIPNRHSSET